MLGNTIKDDSNDCGQADSNTPHEPMPDVSENGGGINLHSSVQQSSFIEDVPEPHPHADFYALPQEPVAEITISEIGGEVDLHNSLQEFSVAEVTPVPHPDHTYLCTSQDGADFYQPADVGIQIGQPTIEAETQTLDMFVHAGEAEKNKILHQSIKEKFLRSDKSSRACIKLTDYLAAMLALPPANQRAQSLPGLLLDVPPVNYSMESEQT
ncbi:hypothetical protein Pmani_004505 [Petrolisthes manimaculis]|uniref:Uncharacterized protein n=1 Tax=Petrolisthes manimaculis TaxID=1843537 RepID=A0AAE1QDI7_9EUCA|nr:hypothetical protein Pmani_004505 [Petrolisthes manimaculis]